VLNRILGMLQKAAKSIRREPFLAGSCADEGIALGTDKAMVWAGATAEQFERAVNFCDHIATATPFLDCSAPSTFRSAAMKRRRILLGPDQVSGTRLTAA